MPADRLHRIGLRYAAAERIDAGEPVLRDRAALHGGLAEERGGAHLVLLNAGAVEQCDRVFDLGIEEVGLGGFAHQAGRLGCVLRHAAAVLVHGRERVLGFRVAGLRRRLEQLGGPLEGLGQLPALEIQPAGALGPTCALAAGRMRAWAVARGPPAPRRRNMASANIASRSPRSAASLYHLAASSSLLGTPKPLA